MTKADIINKIVEDTGLAKQDVATTIEAFMEEVRQSLTIRKEDVFLRGFEAHDYPAFKPAKSFIAKMK